MFVGRAFPKLEVLVADAAEFLMGAGIVTTFATTKESGCILSNMLFTSHTINSREISYTFSFNMIGINKQKYNLASAYGSIDISIA